MSSVSLAPWVDALSPFIDAVLPVIVGSAVTYGVALLHRWFGLQVSASNLEAIRRAAATEAGILVARSETNLAGESIHIGDERVATAARAVAVAVPEAIKATGLTPATVSRIVAGEIGKIQAAPVKAAA